MSVYIFIATGQRTNCWHIIAACLATPQHRIGGIPSPDAPVGEVGMMPPAPTPGRLGNRPAKQLQRESATRQGKPAVAYFHSINKGSQSMASSNLCELIRIANNASYFTDEHCDNMTAEEFDVLICGSGSAGLCAAIWLARYGICFKMLEARDGPLRIGQADGVQCRTVEIFESLGIADALLKESYHVMEIAFWSACSKEGEVGGEQGVIQRDYVGPDTEPGLSHQPHVILNQARVNEIMMDEVVRLSGNQNNVEYGRRVRDVTVVKEAEEDVQVSLKLPYVKVAAEDRHGKSHVYRAQYVLVSQLSSSVSGILSDNL